MKKIAIAALAAVLIVSSLFISTVSLANPIPRTVRGYVYVNGVVTKPDKVTLSIGTQQVTATLFNDGYYIIDFSEEDGETGTFTVTVDGNDYLAEETITTEHEVYIYHINLTVNDRCPDQPSNPSPADGSKVYSTSVTLSVDVNDIDGDTITVSFYTSDGSLIDRDTVSGSGRASVTWSGLSYGTTYSWYAVADDGSCEKSSDTWSFTTKSSGGGGNNNPSPPPPPPPPPANQPPVANAGGPYFGLVSQSITFNGSSSYDPDGSITNYTWDFGDGSTGYGVSPTHIYNSAGIYTVTLTVTDNSNATNAVDTNTTTATVSEKSFNYPPSIPIVSGPSTGHVNMSYNFTAISTDNDSATIQYTFNWGDGETTTTEFVPNGTAVHLNHTWHVPGNYTIRVMAYDNNTISGTATHYIEITVMSEEPTNNSGATTSPDYTVYYVAAILVILLILIFLLGRKKKKT